MQHVLGVIVLAMLHDVGVPLRVALFHPLAEHAAVGAVAIAVEGEVGHRHFALGHGREQHVLRRVRVAHQAAIAQGLFRRGIHEQGVQVYQVRHVDQAALRVGHVLPVQLGGHGLGPGSGGHIAEVQHRFAGRWLGMVDFLVQPLGLADSS